MRHKTRIMFVSAAAGMVVAGLLQMIALLASHAGLAVVAHLVDWPHALLQAFLASPSMAYLASLPFGAAVYAVCAYVLLKKKLGPDAR